MPDLENVVDTQPEVDAAEEAEIQPNEEPTEAEPDAEEAKPAEGEAEVGGAEAQPAEGEEAQAEEPPAPPVVRVKFNKKEMEYTTEQAAPLVEMGLKYESFKPDYERLKDLAAGYGLSVSDLIANLSKNQDDALYQQTLQECDGNETIAKRLFEAAKAERNQRIQAAKEAESKREKQDFEEERTQLTERLSSGFVELSKEFPEFKKFADIPDAIVRTAIDKKISLLDSYLRFQRAESKKAEAVKTKQVAVSKASAGSMQGEPQQADTAFEDFSKAFYSAF